MMIRAIVFDLWGTIATKGDKSIRQNLAAAFSITDPEFLEKYERAIQVHPWNSMDGMACAFLEAFHIEKNRGNINHVTTIFKAGIESARLLPGMKSLVESLKRNYSTALVSNTTSFEAKVVDVLGIRDMFDVVLFSNEVNMLKPSREIFEEAARRLSVKLNECLFVDDFPKNTLAAESYGMRAVVFSDAEQLKNSFSEIGINIT